ncbi:iron chaperone [Anaerosolibacter sp.]|uniref:iron chaperone n=1 Tax=Anaerosolibacter sp. TaxID=1872527 RepID=UPI0039EE6216
MKLVNEYISVIEGIKKEWIILMVNFMREVFPEVEETFDYKMPTYKGDGYFIAFAAQKDYFSFYTNDTRMLSLIKELVPSASMGKGCIRIKYNNEFEIEALMDACKEIIDYHKSNQSSDVTDLKALKKWAKVPSNIQQLLINNVYCLKCGVTTIIDYGIHNDRFGLVLKGTCKKCRGSVARFVEDE